MSEIKTIEQAADEYTSSAYFHLEYSISGTTARECNKAFIEGAKHQKELSDAREKLLLDVISELRKYSRHNNTCDIIEYKDTCSCGFAILLNMETLSSVAKKLEGL